MVAQERLGSAHNRLGHGEGHGAPDDVVSGFARLYFLASLRPTRRHSLRFRQEHAKIGDWLEQIPTLAKTNSALAVEVAQCPGLVKGYGETHERGSRKFDDVMRVVPELASRDDAAPRLRALREAALAEA